MIRMGFGKNKYPEIFFLKSIIKPGDNCIDIGANLGYYSYFISKHCGPYGKLVAVEPINLFAEIWKTNMKKSPNSNYEILQFALGESEGDVKMSTPLINGVLHHGMTKLAQSEDENSAMMSHVEMRNPNELFADMKRINFIKIDIEGCESVVISCMQQLINKHKPIIQAELSGEENRQKVINILNRLNYTALHLESGKLQKFKNSQWTTWSGDFYFLP